MLKPPSKPRHVPEALRSPSSQLEMLKARIRIFWLLRFMMLFLTRYDTELNREIKTNPMMCEVRPVESWQEGQHVQLDGTKWMDDQQTVIQLTAMSPKTMRAVKNVCSSSALMNVYFVLRGRWRAGTGYIFTS